MYATPQRLANITAMLAIVFVVSAVFAISFSELSVVATAEVVVVCGL